MNRPAPARDAEIIDLAARRSCKSPPRSPRPKAPAPLRRADQRAAYVADLDQAQAQIEAALHRAYGGAVLLPIHRRRALEELRDLLEIEARRAEVDMLAPEDVA